jgi:hypothetical protein
LLGRWTDLAAQGLIFAAQGLAAQGLPAHGFFAALGFFAAHGFLAAQGFRLAGAHIAAQGKQGVAARDGLAKAMASTVADTIAHIGRCSTLGGLSGQE